MFYRLRKKIEEKGREIRRRNMNLDGLSVKLLRELGIGRYYVTIDGLKESLSKKIGVQSFLLESTIEEADFAVLNGEDVLKNNEIVERLLKKKNMILWVRSVDKKEKEIVENRLFEMGCVKHPRYHDVCLYNSSDSVVDYHDSLLVTLAENVRDRYPIEYLLDERTLHMDMMRETGRRSEAHTSRYDLASNYLRENDVVVDAACGYGYGSYILKSKVSSVSVVGYDLSEQAIDYGKCVYGSNGGPVFSVNDVEDMSHVESESVDLVTSFETVEHVPNPKKMLGEFFRILKPGGRLIASVPNMWVDENGNDPNPHHLHVYDREKIVKEISEYFDIEKLVGQNAGGNSIKLEKATRSFFDLTNDRDAEWIIVVAVKSSSSGSCAYEDNRYKYDVEVVEALRNKGLEDKYLNRMIVDVSTRVSNKFVLEKIIKKKEEGLSVVNDDLASIVCVSGYRKLENFQEMEIKDFLEKNRDKFFNVEEVSMRWKVSLSYLYGLMYEKIGNVEEAVKCYMRYDAKDALSFHPSLLTKIVDGSINASNLYLLIGEKKESLKCLKRGLESVYVMWDSDVDSEKVFGRKNKPLTFYFREMDQVLWKCEMIAEAICAYDETSMGKYGIMVGQLKNKRLSNSEVDKLKEEKERFERIVDKIKGVFPYWLIDKMKKYV